MTASAMASTSPRIEGSHLFKKSVIVFALVPKRWARPLDLE